MEQHLLTILIDQYLSNRALYEHIYLENIKLFYKFSSKCDDQQQYKSIIKAVMVSTLEWIIKFVQWILLY